MATRRPRNRRAAFPLRLAGLATLLVTVAFTLVTATWAVLTPIYSAPDEAPHLSTTARLLESSTWPAPGDAFIAGWVMETRGERLDVAAMDRATVAEVMAQRPADTDQVDQMTQHPPLFYGIAAGALAALGFPDMRWDHAVLVLRGIGVLLAIPLPLLVASSVREVVRSRKAGIVAGASLLAVPQLPFIMGSASNESLAITLLVLLSWLLVRAMRRPPSVWRLVAIGVVLGAALLTKGTALPAIPGVAAVMLLAPLGGGLVRRAGSALLALAIAFVVGGWWWLRNLVVYGAVQPSGLAGVRVDTPWPDGTGPDPLQFLDTAWTHFTVSFWGKFGALLFPLPIALTSVLTVAALLLLALHAFRERGTRRTMLVAAGLPALSLAIVIATSYALYTRTQLMAALQGRYLFPWILLLIVLVGVALMAKLQPGAQRRRWGVGAVVLAMGMTLVGFARAYVGYYEGDELALHAANVRNWLALSPIGPIATAVLIAVTMATLALSAAVVRCTIGRVGATDERASSSVASAGDARLAPQRG